MEKKYTPEDIKAVTARESVRLMPEIYFQKCFDAQNLNDLPLELACHAIDECYENNCTSIELTLFNDHFCLKYNAGMSLEMKDGKCIAELIMTTLFACSNEKKHLSVGEEFCELGIATINFASEYCVLTTVYSGQLGRFHFNEGELTSHQLKQIENQANYTEITLKPDPVLFNEIYFSVEGVRSKVQKLAMKLEGISIVLIDQSSN